MGKKSKIGNVGHLVFSTKVDFVIFFPEFGLISADLMLELVSGICIIVVSVRNRGWGCGYDWGWG